MKAMVVREFGEPEKLELAEMPVPKPGAGEVLVRVRAASVNPVDYKIRRSGAWAGVPMPAIICYDAPGVVEAVGANVTHLVPGGEVFYCARIFEQAASLPLAAMTAYDAILAARGQVKPVIDSTLPLERLADAHRKLEAGGMRGKIVITIG